MTFYYHLTASTQKYIIFSCRPPSQPLLFILFVSIFCSAATHNIFTSFKSCVLSAFPVSFLFVRCISRLSGVRLVFLAARFASLTHQKPRQRSGAVMVLRSHARKIYCIIYLCLRAGRHKKLAHFRRQLFTPPQTSIGRLPAPFHWRHGLAALQTLCLLSTFALPPLPPWRFFLYPLPPLPPHPFGVWGFRVVHPLMVICF